MKVLICTLIIHFVCISTMYAQETPIETIEMWNACYGTAEMDRCGDITTASMRDNAPKSVWVYDTWKQLNAINYRKETSEIVQQQIDDERAVIVLQSRIYALDGYVDQKELFTLLNIDGIWLVDNLVVGDEVLEDQQEAL